MHAGRTSLSTIRQSFIRSRTKLNIFNIYIAHTKIQTTTDAATALPATVLLVSTQLCSMVRFISASLADRAKLAGDKYTT